MAGAGATNCRRPLPPVWSAGSGRTSKMADRVQRQALSYRQHSEVQQGLGLQMIDRLDLRRATTVLDFGCGTGNLTKHLAERIGPEGKVVAIDQDKERLKIARETCSASNIDYIEADDKTFPEGQYDLIFANAVMHWIMDKRALFERVYRNLKPGGQFAFVTFDGTPKVNHEVVRRMFEELVSPHFFDELYSTRLDGSAYEALATSVGYVKVFAESEEHWGRWENLDDCVDKWFSGLQGFFDPEKFDMEKFQRIKDEYGDGEVVYEKPNGMLFMILERPR